MRTGLPWILVGLIAGAWAGATWLRDGSSAEKGNETQAPQLDLSLPGQATDAALASQIAALQGALSELKSEVQALRNERSSRGPALAARAGAPEAGERATRPVPVAEREPAFQEREAAARKKRLADEARRKRSQSASAQIKTWLDATRSLKDASARSATFAEIRAAFDGDDDAQTLAALRTSRWLGNADYDRADFRQGILPHARSKDPEIRRAALEALAWVQPEPEDLAPWLAEAKLADRNNAEATAMALARVSAGVIRGETADAVLHLLRDGTKIKKAFVIRGLQSAKEWGASVEQRLIDIVRSVPAHDYDSAYYFHFITPRLDPKSDAVIDLMLERIEEGKAEISTIVRGFRVGLDEAQRDRVSSKLLDYAEDAPNARVISALAEGLRWTARAQHVARMKALITGDQVQSSAKRAMERAIKDAEQRR